MPDTITNGDKFIGQQELISKLDQPALLLDGEQITFANDAARKLLGNHITGANVRLALRAPSAISTALSNRPGRTLVPRIGTPDSLWELSSQPLGGRIRLMTLKDVSAEQSIARIHADFVANASHELRTPVASILGFAEALLDPSTGSNTEMRSKFLTTIQREGKRMEAMIADLMSLSRIEEEKHRLPDMLVDLAELCRNSSNEFAESDNLVVEVPDHMCHIYGDETRLRQMLRNLIDNALKYRRADGDVTLSLEQTKGGWAVIKVHNHGPPIPAQMLPRLTERFFRVDEARSKAVGGTGLGLSIVKHIVIRHRGRLNIDSSAESGTTFEAVFPLHKK